MNELAENLIEALKEQEAAVGATILWNGGRYPCSGGELIGGKLLGAGGYRVKSQGTIIVRKEMFPGDSGGPAEKQTLMYRPQEGAQNHPLRIVSVNPLWDRILVMECDYPGQG